MTNVERCLPHSKNPAWNNIALALAKQIISNLILSEEEEKILPCFGKNYSQNKNISNGLSQKWGSSVQLSFWLIAHVYFGV